MKQVLNTYSPWLDMERIYEMNKFVLLFFIFFGLSYSSALRAETILYCKSELATGFFVDKGKEWSEIGFIRKSFTLKFNQDYTTSNVAVPARSQVMKCSKPYSFEPQFTSCIEERFPWQPLIYNKNSKRFVFAVLSSAGYV